MLVPECIVLIIAIYCGSMFSLNGWLNLWLPALNKGGGPHSEEGRYLSKPLFSHVGSYVGSMQCHIHMHKILHSAMLAVWRKWLFAQESGVEKQLRKQNRTQSAISLVAP
jgi:hypothetical protein